MLLVVAFVGGEGAPVASGDGGTTLQCRCGRRKVRVASYGDNGGGLKGLIVKRRRQWCSDGNQRGRGGLQRWKPVRQARRRWRRRGARACTRRGVRHQCLLQFSGRATRQREKERNRGVGRGRQPDHGVGMAPSGAIGGGRVRSRWRWVGEQERAAGHTRRGAVRLTGGTGRQRGPVSAAG
jgi:hypothetical protein